MAMKLPITEDDAQTKLRQVMTDVEIDHAILRDAESALAAAYDNYRSALQKANDSGGRVWDTREGLRALGYAESRRFKKMYADHCERLYGKDDDRTRWAREAVARMNEETTNAAQ